MRLLTSLILIAGLAAAVPAVSAQESQPAEGAAHEGGSAMSHEGGSEASSEGHEGGGMTMWKWANFLVLAGGLGYLAVKNGGAFFNARSRQIHKDIESAAILHKEAEAKAAEIDRRMAHLEADIKNLREEAHQEAEAEKQRLAHQTESEMQKIQAHAEQEIAAAAKAARMELKRYSAHLAVELAKQKIEGQMTPATQEALVEGFERDLGGPSSRARTT